MSLEEQIELIEDRVRKIDMTIEGGVDDIVTTLKQLIEVLRNINTDIQQIRK